MSKNWDTLIENHFAKKKERSRLTLKMLLKSVNEAMGEMPVKDEYLLTEESGKKRFSMSIPIPRMIPSEAWGDPSSQSRQDVDRIFASITRGPDIEARIAHVNSFLDPVQAVKKAPGGKVNTLLNMMQIIEALQATINDFNESSAGFVFEGFMAALTGGRQEAGRVGGTLPIEDFITGDGENVSLKLLSPNTGIHGSFTNLVDYLFIRGGSGVENIKYLIAYKNSENDAVAQLALWEFMIGRENFIDIMVISKNGNLLGEQAEALKRHTQIWQDSPEWRKTMAKLLLQTPGYTNKKGMFFANLTATGEFEEREDAVPDPKVKQNQFNLMLKQGQLNKLKVAAKEEGALAAKDGTTFDDWIQDFNLALPPKLKSGKEGKKRKAALKALEASFERGYAEARASREKGGVVAESYFGSFHEREKKLMKEEVLLEDAASGGSQFSISRGDMTQIEPLAQTKFYGVIDLGQKNIDELVKIYIEKLGEDLMALLENTKNFSENIGRYFSEDDRAVATTANQTARGQGEEIIKSLEEREKEEEV